MKSNSFMRESHRGAETEETEEFATDKREFSRIRNRRFRSVSIRVHSWLIHLSLLRAFVSLWQAFRDCGAAIPGRLRSFRSEWKKKNARDLRRAGQRPQP